MHRTAISLMREEQRLQAQKLIDQMSFPSWLKTGELELDAAHIVYRDSHLEGLMAPSLVTDPIWPAAVELTSGSWAISESLDTSLFHSLYASSFSCFEGKALLHRIVCPSSQRLLGLWSTLGFAPVQVYGSRETARPSTVLEEQTFRVREATLNDSGTLREFSSILALHQSRGPIWAGAPEQYLKGLEQGFAELPEQKDVKTFILETEDGEPVGYSVWEPDERSGVVYLAATAIHETYRGKGAGRALLEHALRRLAAHGYSKAVTDWRCANLRADSFWRSSGFKIEAYRIERRFLAGEFQRS